MSLKVYHKKRDFNKTPEPFGKKTRAQKIQKYIIQKHAASHLHYDFRLELDGVLKSWAVPKGPCLDPSVKRLAMHVEDHPIEYGSFEGIIPAGEYGGGTVMLWDKGTWEFIGDNALKSYKKGDLKFKINGSKLKGEWKLININHNPKTWLLIKVKDKYAKSINEYDVTEEKPLSVVSGQDLDEIADQTLSKKIKKKILELKAHPASMLKLITPELCTLVTEAPDGDEWLHEIKLDGYRLISFIKQDKIKLLTRRHQDWTKQFSSIQIALKKLKLKNCILDGEVVILDKKQHSDFQLLQNSIKFGSEDFIYYIFDILYYDGYDLTKLPLIQRKEILQELIEDKEYAIRYSDHVLGNGPQVFAKACEMGLEGIISKQIASEYLQKRTQNWLKVKCSQRQEFIIAGYTTPSGGRKHFGSLLLAVYDDKQELIYCGNVGTGFTQKYLESLYSKFQKYKTNKVPFKTRPAASKNVTWLKPVIVCEIEFMTWTKDGILRHPSFKGIKNDKMAKQIKRELPKHLKKSKSTKTLSNPNKFYYPEDKITKLDLYNYYVQVKNWILPYLVNRALTLVRCPGGYASSCFYQKHINSGTPKELHGVKIKNKNGKSEEYIYIDDEAGLLALPQLGALELHPWGSKIEKIEYPDIIIFDIDPAPDVSWSRVVEAAFAVKSQLDKLKLKSFVKTTGGKGLHVFVPIKPEYKWDDIKEFSHLLVQYLCMQHPKSYLSVMNKAKRKGKIFIDYLRNSRGATAVAPFSTRAKKHATVSVPLDWDELTKKIEDTTYTIKTLPKRLQNQKKDPWEKFFKIKQSLDLDKFKK